MMPKHYTSVRGSSDYLREVDPDGYRAATDRYEPSGFQYGWAANAARYCLDLPPAPNPALIERAVLEALAAQLMVVVHRAWDAGHAAGKAEQEGGR